MSGQNLANLCKGPAFDRSSACLAYVLGVRDALFLGATIASVQMFSSATVDFQIGKAHEWLDICEPDNVKGGQVAEVVVKYLENHPAELHTAAVGLVRNALMEAFPCPQ